jgi:hypothetical protein
MHLLRRKSLPTLSLFFVTLAALSCGSIHAADHPDLSGTWKLDASKSDFGPFPGPSSMVDRIEQKTGEVTVNRDRAGEAVVLHIPLDGTPRSNEIRGVATQTTGRWDGNTLVIDYSGQQRGRPAKSEERWTVSADGKTMQVVRQLSGAMGSTEQTLLMVKQ